MNNVDEYISSFPEQIQKLLKEIRTIIKFNVPDAVEGFSYGMPSYKYKRKQLAYFAGFKNHIGFYATPNSHNVFADELKKYKHGKGSVQFPLDQPLPVDLIIGMLAFKKQDIEQKFIK